MRLRRHVSLVVFALGFCALGWLAGHCLAYVVTGGHAHHAGHGAPHMGVYMSALPIPAIVALIVGFGALVRLAFVQGSLGATLGTRRQLALAAFVPAGLFVASELLQSALTAAPAPAPRLLVAGVLLQAVLGGLILLLVRLTVSAVELAVGAVRGRHPRAARMLGRPPIPVLSSPVSLLARCLAGRAPPALVPVV
jgi:hypothetical protein